MNHRYYRLGWRNDLERFGALRPSALKSFRRPASVPELFDPSGWMKIEDQQQTNSCTGHGATTAAELLYWLATKGTVIQLSRMFAYITAQRIDGLAGRDEGATITGVVKALERDGVCLEELCPFTGRYFSALSPAAVADAQERQVLKHVEIESAEAAVDWIGGGMGAVVIGVPCGQLMFNVKDVLSGADEGGGGHAMAVVGYDLRRRLLRVPGSWGTRYANNGWFWVPFSVFDRWCAMVRSRVAEVWGVTNMEAPMPRDISFVDQMVG